MEMNGILFILILVAFGVNGESYYSSGYLNSTQAFTLLTLDISFNEQTTTVSVRFKPKNSHSVDGLTNVMAVVKFEEIAENYITPQQISQFYQTNSDELLYMRPVDAIGGYTQVINLPVTETAKAQDKLYIGIFNFDLPQKNTIKQYQLRVDTLSEGKICSSCPQGTMLATGIQYLYKCQCYPCGNRVGSTCQYQLTDLKLGGSTYFILNNQNHRYLRLEMDDSPAKLNIYSTSSSANLKIYAQYESVEGSIAGKMNNYHENATAPIYFMINNNISTVFQINNNNGKAVLLTFVSYHYIAAGVYVNFINQNTTSKSFIIVVLLVSLVVILIIMIIAGVFIRRWWIKKQNAVPSTIVASSQNEQDQNILTQQQVNNFFPLMKAYFIIQKDKLSAVGSQAHLQQSQQQQSNASHLYTHYECAVCFQMIRYMEDVRVVYCKHIFHDKCLIQWFTKNFNCPICRKAFDYQSTKNMYKQVSKGKRIKGKDLGRAILGVQGPANIPKRFAEKQLELNVQVSNKYQEESSQYREQV